MSENKEKQIAKFTDFLLTGAETKRSFEESYLKIIFQQHKDLEVHYILDFLHKAQMSGANPVLNQIYLTKYFSTKQGKYIAATVFSYHFFLARANETGELNGITVESNIEKVFNPITGKEIPMLVATAKVDREGRTPTIFKARFQEFYNAQSGNWRDKPYVMLEKTAMANALRWAFPEVVSGMYIEEETKFNEDENQATTISNRKEETPKEAEKTIIEVMTEDEALISQITSMIGKFRASGIKDKVAFMKRIGISSIKDLHSKKTHELESILAQVEIHITEKGGN